MPLEESKIKAKVISYCKRHKRRLKRTANEIKFRLEYQNGILLFSLLTHKNGLLRLMRYKIGILGRVRRVEVSRRLFVLSLRLKNWTTCCS